MGCCTMRHGRPAKAAVGVYASTIERAVEMTLADPPGKATHWTGRAIAKPVEISLRSVPRIWAAHGLQRHRVRRFKLSNDAEVYRQDSGHRRPPSGSAEHTLVPVGQSPVTTRGTAPPHCSPRLTCWRGV